MKVDFLAVGGGQDYRKPSLDAFFGHDPSQSRVIVESLCAGGEGVYRGRMSATDRHEINC